MARIRGLDDLMAEIMELGCRRPIQNYFAGIARAHDVEPLLEIINGEMVGNDRR